MPQRSSQTLILSGLGTNCEKETLYASRLAGAKQVRSLHLLSLPRQGLPLEGVGLLILVGGFLDGDNLGAARVCANRLLYQALPNGQTAASTLHRFVAQGGLILGICNGFQLLVQLGLLGNQTQSTCQNTALIRHVTLARNANGNFENRWVNLHVTQNSPCIFTRGLQTLELPVRCGEGRMMANQPAHLSRLMAQGLAPLRYADETKQPSEDYPFNPCGSRFAIAALCNTTGTVMGIMPHPEAFVHQTQHPRWTRGDWQAEAGDGLRLLRNAYAYLKGA